VILPDRIYYVMPILSTHLLLILGTPKIELMIMTYYG